DLRRARHRSRGLRRGFRRLSPAGARRGRREPRSLAGRAARRARARRGPRMGARARGRGARDRALPGLRRRGQRESHQDHAAGGDRRNRSCGSDHRGVPQLRRARADRAQGAREMVARVRRYRGRDRRARGSVARRAAAAGRARRARRPPAGGRPRGAGAPRVPDVRRARSARQGERPLPACARASGARRHRGGPQAVAVCSRDRAALQRRPANAIGDRTLTAEQQTGLEAEETRELIKNFHDSFARIRSEVRKVIVGQDEVVESLLLTLLVGGHCLITGMPGTAKTLLVRTLAQALGLTFKRIQFTPDLMPTDVTGTDIIEEDITTGRRTWTFVPGPIFANVLLADEVNRTPPKTQSALLEAMQEFSVTVRGHHHKIE